MKFEFKTKKAVGIRVTPTVHRLIARGNAARHRDWAAAAKAYSAALARDPTLYAIQVQLGHAAKEAGFFDLSEKAYRAAAKLRGDAGEPFLHLGHLAKRLGNHAQAIANYAEAARHDDASVDALREVREVMAPMVGLDDAMLRLILTKPEPRSPTHAKPEPDAEAIGRLNTALERVVDALPASEREALQHARERIARIGTADDEPQAAPIGRPLVFDLTDLVAHFRNHRLPSGIQRVQIEVLATALRTQGRDQVHICCFLDGRDSWVGIPLDRFLTLATLASSGSDAGDSTWAEARARLFFGLAVDSHFMMPERAILVNLGTSWWIYDYFRLIREAKTQAGISYVPFVHDWIPIMAPEHVVRGVSEDFVTWAVGVFTHADAFLVNSDSTRTDLLRIADRLGHEVDERLIEVVPLDAEFRAGLAAPLPDETLGRWGLRSGDYALFVSTIESRKNHVLAFAGWAELIRRHGANAMPRLVCVGRDGWLNDRAFAKLEADPALRAAVTIIYHVSDEELALLYRCCRFTIYPSHYEGWGLPITESLCYGRVPVVADNSSLPEAGAGLAVLFESNSLPAFVRAVEATAFDHAAREAREAAIATGFRPRPWALIASQINGALARFFAEPRRTDTTLTRSVRLGDYYPLALHKGGRLWPGLASGEIFRAGDGWLWPETSGCRTRPAGGMLRLTVADPPADMRLYLLLRGLAAAACRFTADIEGVTICEGELKAGEERWTSGDLPCNAGADLLIRIRSDADEVITMSTGGSEKRLRSGLTVIGFCLCDAADEEQRALFVSAAGFGDLETRNAYRDRRLRQAA